MNNKMTKMTKMTIEERKQHRYNLRQERRAAALNELKAKEEKQRLTDERYMKEALKLAKKAAKLGEVPIGAVVVYEDKIIGRGYNRRTVDKSTLSHAEITAIKRASKVLGDWRLENATIYITLEPCQMCAGAIVQARIKRAVIGCMSPKTGCAGSILNILQMREFNHQTDIQKGILEQECSSILSDFFENLRNTAKINKMDR